MPSTLNTLSDIFRHRKTTAIRDGKIDINRVRGEIALGGYVDRDFIQICAAIEKTGDAMVDDWLTACGEAADQKFNKLTLRKSAHDLIEGFIVDAKTWRRIPPAFQGHHTTNRYMDEELDKVRERLEARFDDGQNRIAVGSRLHRPARPSTTFIRANSDQDRRAAASAVSAISTRSSSGVP